MKIVHSLENRSKFHRQSGSSQTSLKVGYRVALVIGRALTVLGRRCRIAGQRIPSDYQQLKTRMMGYITFIPYS